MMQRSPENLNIQEKLQVSMKEAYSNYPTFAQPYGSQAPQSAVIPEEGEVIQPWPSDRPDAPPLVTSKTIEEAREKFPGDPVLSLSHKNEIRMAALRRQLQVYGNTPAWYYVSSFLVMVGTVISLFFFAQDRWVKSQADIDLD
ncbi:hypothetical protein GUITHDRAFT_116101 [Guillardia theta CCMP2712]|uniref:Uncharacterized protein n=1 Tax=Guillardia theta (strain CCMP2712) TaxID=905079 RepID=L1IPL1_GUITC|nr:hypothetical protein GUITHDRAFT_116101 [Guillardia theta CCMP2712]EKX37794.1 hypothetical protein GUITHDRAFT_116101 [Guillardia theta CCMP2712]|eukprot:XP_005824774.1 hypothetical protein GUITHDRAFT_116101 [Guillardia theta CCMP2712]